MEQINVSIQDRIAVITLNRPPANALSSGLLRELAATFDELEMNDSVKVIVLRGEGRFFSAGADIKEFLEIESDSGFQHLASYGQELFNRIEHFKKPVIAAIHGAALGGGLELAMACHFRLVSENAKLGLPESTLGLIPGYAGTQRLPRYVGKAYATEMILTGEPITGSQAVSLGLANHAYPDDQLVEETQKLAQKIADKSALSIRFALELLNHTIHPDFHEGVKKEAKAFAELFQSEDSKEGIQAFLEKRKPQFKDK